MFFAKIWKIKPQHPAAAASAPISAIVRPPAVHLRARARPRGRRLRGKICRWKAAGGDVTLPSPRRTHPLATHPDDHHLDGHVLREADGGPEVGGQGDEEVQDGHQVLPVDRCGREESEAQGIRPSTGRCPHGPQRQGQDRPWTAQRRASSVSSSLLSSSFLPLPWVTVRPLSKAAWLLKQ